MKVILEGIHCNKEGLTQIVAYSNYETEQQCVTTILQMYDGSLDKFVNFYFGEEEVGESEANTQELLEEIVDE